MHLEFHSGDLLHKSGFKKKKKSISDLTNCGFCHCKWPRFPSRIIFLGYVIVGVISELIHEEIVRNFMRQRDGKAGSSGEREDLTLVKQYTEFRRCLSWSSGQFFRNCKLYSLREYIK